MTREAYRRSGVDVAAGERAVDRMRQRVEETFGPEVLTPLGGFAAAVAIPAGMRDPVLVSATDGVGTKTAIASRMQRYGTIGQDLVAMCADDVACLGARPFFFLDYVAVEHLDPDAVAELVEGIATACREAGCALVGGETAEHPGAMAEEGFDLAGFCVGVAERADLLAEPRARPGDILIGVAASGLHANGFSLVRSLIAEHEVDLGAPFLELVRRTLGEGEAERLATDEPSRLMASVGDVLLVPTTLYVPHLLALRDHLHAQGWEISGYAHVTGGGLPANVPRALPEDTLARLDPDRWPVPSVVRAFAALGGIEGPEMRAIFNGGLGMVLAVDAAAAEAATAFLPQRGLAAWIVGEVAAADGGVRYEEGPLRSVAG